METLQATGTVRGVFFNIGTTSTNYPKSDCAKAVIDLFKKTKKTAHVAINSFTEPEIVDAIIAANKRCVNVTMVADKTASMNAHQDAIISKLTQACLCWGRVG
jgi:hypothetical protein